MTPRGFAASAALALLSCRPATPPATANRSQSDARSFVVQFYDWYRPDSGTSRNLNDVLHDRPQVFEPQLFALIKGGEQCEGVNPHSVCDLGVDPFLDSQNPCQRYEVGEATAKNGAYWVAVFAVCDGRRDTIPTVLAIVAPRDSTWQFVNFVYGGGQTSLRQLLQEGHSR